MRAEFLGMVSHELRAPLTSIKGSAEVAQFFRIIDEQADRMDSLIRRPARRRAHRHRHAVGRARALRGRRAGGPGARDVHQRRRATHRPHRPAARPAPGHGRPAAPGAGAQQPARQRRAPRAGLRAHPDRGGARGAGCGGLGRRRGPGHRAGPARPAVPQIHHRRGPEGRPRQRAGPRHLQGPGRGPGGGASGPRAAASASARASPSRSRWPRRPATVPPRPAGPRAGRAVPILVVDDDPETLRHLRDTLAEAGYAPLVTTAPPNTLHSCRVSKGLHQVAGSAPAVSAAASWGTILSTVFWSVGVTC